MANETYSFEIAAEVTKARKEIAAFAKETQKQLDNIKSDGSTTALATGFLAVKEIATTAFNAISTVVGESINQSLEAEKANIQLANSMKLVGDFTQDALKEFDDYATTLSKTSEASDDQIKSSLALAKAFKLTNKEAQGVVTAATELSVITGDSLNSSVEKLAKTYNGFLSRDLGALIPELKTLSEEQLRSGIAVDITGKKFAGSAAEIKNTFGGSLNDTKKGLGEVFEALGNLITQNEGFQAILKGTASAAYASANGIKQLQEESKKTVQVVDDLDIVFNKQGIILDDLSASIDKAKESQKDFSDELKAAQRIAQSEKPKKIKTDKEIDEERKRLIAFEKVKDEFKSKEQEIERQGTTDLERILLDRNRSLKLIDDARRQGIIDNDARAFELKLKILKKASKEEYDFLKQNAEKTKALNAAFASDNGRFITASINNEKISEQQGIAAAAGFIKTVLQGAEGAKELVGTIAGAIGDAIVPGIGGIVKQIVEFLAQGPDKVRETVRAFAKELPNVITNIIEALPVLITEIIKIIPTFVKGFVERIPEIIKALVAAIPELMAAIVAAMPQAAIALVTGIISNIPEIVKGFAEEFLKIPEKFFKALLEQIPVLGKAFGGGGGGGGFLSNIPVVGDLIGGIGDILGFADGGRIADSSRFSNDTIVARVGAGEQILGRDLTSQLEDFLANQGQSQPLVINLQIGQSQLAKVLLDLDRGGFRTAAS